MFADRVRDPGMMSGALSLSESDASGGISDGISNADGRGASES